jgi:hypothetical protein
MRMLLEHIELFTNSIEELEVNIHQIFSPPSYTTGSDTFTGSNLLTIPGVGEKMLSGKTQKQALNCVAKKLLQIMSAMLKSSEPYNPALVFVPF